MRASHAGRIMLVAVPSALAASLLMGGVAEGAVPVSFAVSGSQFQIGASKLEGTGFSQYAGVAKDTEGKEHPVAIANIKSATLSDLCQSVVTETPLGKVGVLIKAGGGGSPASASDLQIGMTGLKGDAAFGNIRIGVDASTVNTAAKGSAGDFAQDSGSISITNLQQTAWSTQASVFTLTGMSMQLTDGSKGCF
ncbi:cholesterol esterase [Sinomonas humi]|uniref:Cholesterol esterase n=2 Tax=Sinomonas humi TaxID=1338436 RepID=A0A0B2AEJ5_9MICC|nr:cholesterol esterase [Sinomonas humi]